MYKMQIFYRCKRICPTLDGYSITENYVHGKPITLKVFDGIKLLQSFRISLSNHASIKPVSNKLLSVCKTNSWANAVHNEKCQSKPQGGTHLEVHNSKKCAAYLFTGPTVFPFRPTLCYSRGKDQNWQQIKNLVKANISNSTHCQYPYREGVLTNPAIKFKIKVHHFKHSVCSDQSPIIQFE